MIRLTPNNDIMEARDLRDYAKKMSREPVL